MPPCGPSTKQSVAISRYGSCMPSTRPVPAPILEDAARDLAAAEIAVRHAFTAVESTDKPVKIEVEILQDRPTRALLEASRWAAMVCVGAMGLKHSAQGGLAQPRRRWRRPPTAPSPSSADTIRSRRNNSGWSPRSTNLPASDGVLRRALEEAQLRGAPLRVLTTWQSRFTDIHDGDAVADGNRLARAQLDRRLAQWKKRYPDLDVRAVAVHGSTLNFLTKNAGSIQLLVVGHERAQGITALVGPPGLRGVARTRIVRC